MHEFPELLEKEWRWNRLKHSYYCHSLKHLEEKASKLHTWIEATGTPDGSLFSLRTRIHGDEKEGYQLDVRIKRYEKHQHKENTHQQETDL